MKISAIVWTVLIVVAAFGVLAYWHWGTMQIAQPMSSVSNQTVIQTSTTTPQGDGTGVGENLILGLNTSAKLGSYLNAYNGMTVYTYSKDTRGISNCSGACAQAWPPYTVPSLASIHVSSAINGTVSAITRTDGSLQVTYNGMPLYFWQGDVKPGDTTGQGIGGFSVVTP
jgi:predicted lipoprotein with Yx(FWY)xxD motif